MAKILFQGFNFEIFMPNRTLKTPILLFFLISSSIIYAQQKNQHGLVKWLSFKEAQELNKKQAKPFIIDVYTDWCGWCKHMEKTTYSDAGLANYINTYFYPVQFDAETKDTIEYNGETFWNSGKEKKSPHQLAIKFLGNRLSYPSTIFVSNNFQFSLLSQGYLDVKKIEPLLIYTVENVFRRTNYESFSEKFDKTFYDTTAVKEDLKWLSINEALFKQKKEAKKILVFTNANFCNSCKIMRKTIFNDTAVAKYINKEFYLVDLNVELKDDVEFQGKLIKPGDVQGYPFHPITLYLTRNNMVLPSITLVGENQDVLDVIPYYLSEEILLPILHYYADNKFKNTKWEDYLKEYKKK